MSHRDIVQTIPVSPELEAKLADLFDASKIVPITPEMRERFDRLEFTMPPTDDD